MFGCSDKKFEVVQNQIDQKYREPPGKIALYNDGYFKRKGNSSLQFKFSSELKDDIEDILDDIIFLSQLLNTIVSKRTSDENCRSFLGWTGTYC